MLKKKNQSKFYLKKYHFKIRFTDRIVNWLLNFVLYKMSLKKFYRESSRGVKQNGVNFCSYSRYFCIKFAFPPLIFLKIYFNIYCCGVLNCPMIFNLSYKIYLLGIRKKFLFQVDKFCMTKLHSILFDPLEDPFGEKIKILKYFYNIFDFWRFFSSGF